MTIKSIETFSNQAVGFTRVTAHDGAVGWGAWSSQRSAYAAIEGRLGGGRRSLRVRPGTPPARRASNPAS